MPETGPFSLEHFSSFFKFPLSEKFSPSSKQLNSNKHANHLYDLFKLSEVRPPRQVPGTAPSAQHAKHVKDGQASRCEDVMPDAL